MHKLNILVVDDSAFMRKLITDCINEDYRMTVIATARNGRDALNKIVELKPDVITLDINLPDISGIEVLMKIMESQPTPTVILSSQADKGTSITVEAMALGAVGFVNKPSGEISLDLYKVKAELINKIIEASKSQVKKSVTEESLSQTFEKGISNRQVNLVCIGASTGGPRALRTVISKLPKNLPMPIIVVQHMPANFTKSFAEKLNSWSEVVVKEASDGEILKNGVVYLAPGGYQTRVSRIGNTLSFNVDKSPPIKGLRPSYDVLLNSIADILIEEVVTVTLTGMGSDGAIGLRKLKKVSKVFAIAESERTAVIFGMPKAAIATGLVDESLDLENIPAAIVKHIR